MKNLKLLPFYFCLLILTGCATLPTRENLAIYNLDGVNYLSLVALCDLRGINWEYDAFSKRIALSKDAHRINLMVGEKLIAVDGQTQHLRHPIDIYQGAVVVPYKFKEEVIDVLFKETHPPQRAVSGWTAIKRVVIDAGHGGTDPGAIGRTGIREKIITLDMSKRINILLRSKGIEVVMTRSTDKFVPLERRVEIADNAKADLFLSIHANANRVRSMKGFEAYYIAYDVDDANRAMSAARNYVLDLDNASFAENSLNLKATLWDMIYTYNRQEAVELARSICAAMERELNMKILRIRGARFYVLKGTHIPAVLLEIGFLSNSEEERMLKNSYYRQKIAEAITQGIGDYASGLILASGE